MVKCSNKTYALTLPSIAWVLRMTHRLQGEE